MSSYDVFDFEKEVIEESYKKPVLVDFWAEWCQPCRILGPVLEEIAKENPGMFKLVKINTEKFPQLSARYKISSIPNVKLFVDGEVRAEFLGAQPKPMVLKWIEEHVATEGEKELVRIKIELDNMGFTKSVRKQLARLIFDEPALHEARLLLAANIVIDEPTKASEFLDIIQADSSHYHTAQAIMAVARAVALKETDLEKGHFSGKMWKSIQALKKNDFETALELLIDIIMINKKYMDELPRKLCLGIFYILGGEHEITAKYRKRFDMALY